MKLVSTVPGVEIRLTPNPLRCVTTLTESARREITLTLVLETTLNDIFSAKFDLDNDGVTFVAGSPPLDGKKEALSVLNHAMEGWIDADGTRPMFETYKALAHGVDDYIAALNEQHAGDCVKLACSCSRCHVESLIGVNTCPGDADCRSYLWGIYAASEDIAAEDIPWRDEQRKRTADYEAKHGKQPRSAMIDYAKWEPIWAANKAKAVEVYAQHKRAYAEQQAALHAKPEGQAVIDGREASRPDETETGLETK